MIHMDEERSMDGYDTDLRLRLVRLEASLPAQAQPETGSSTLGRRLGSVGLGVALAVVLAGAVAAAAGVAVISGAITGHPGLWDPGQPLACSGLWRMSPPRAATWLAQHGYTVTWQVEARDGSHRGTSTQTQEPPAAGYVKGGIVEGTAATIVVETGPGAEPAMVANACP